MLVSETWTFGVLVFLASALASGAGTGGGALYMPVYVLKYHGDTHSAVPLSKATILGLAIAALISNLWRKHPKSEYNQLLNTPIAALLEPPTLLGAIIGVNLNLVLPSVVILFLLIISLSITAFMTFKKAKRLYLTEKSHNNIAQIDATSNYQFSRPLVVSYANKQEIENNNMRFGGGEYQNLSLVFSESTSVSTELPGSNEMAIQKWFYNKDLLSHYSLNALCTAILVLNWAVHWMTLFFAGGPAALICGNSRQKKLMYFLTGFHLICITAYLLYLRQIRKTNAQNSIREESTFSGGLQWTEDTKKLCWYCVCALFAGLAAGALGIGGGLIKGPLMLQIGLNPLSAVSTASLMLLFTSSSTTLSYSLTGQLHFRDALNFGFISFCGSLVGIWFVTVVVKKRNLQSFVSFFLFLVILISMLCLVSLTIISTVVKNGQFAKETFYPLKQACEALT